MGDRGLAMSLQSLVIGSRGFFAVQKSDFGFFELSGVFSSPNSSPHLFLLGCVQTEIVQIQAALRPPESPPRPPVSSNDGVSNPAADSVTALLQNSRGLYCYKKSLQPPALQRPGPARGDQTPLTSAF